MPKSHGNKFTHVNQSPYFNMEAASAPIKRRSSNALRKTFSFFGLNKFNSSYSHRVRFLSS